MIELKLGKKPYIKRPETLKLEDYLTTALPTPPIIYGHQNLIATKGWGMLGNDTVGDCVIADLGHRTMLWTAEGSTMTPFSAANTIKDYSAITGYNPDDPNSDQGTEFITALEYNQKTGMLDGAGARHKIGPYVSIDQTNMTLIKQVASIFGIVDTGIQFPDSAMTQFNAGKPWDVVSGAKIEGGHGIPIVAYDSNYLYCVTWGQLQPMTYAFAKKYIDETWLAFSTEFLKAGVSPDGLDINALNVDYAAVTGQPTPAPVPVNPPVTGCPAAVSKAIADLNTALPLLKKSTSKYVKTAIVDVEQALTDLNYT